MARKSLVTRFGEAIDQHLEDRATRTPVSVSIRRRSRVFSLLPTPGNVVFTLLIVTMLVVANRAGAININAPAATSTATIPYQGRLATASGIPYTGLQNMEFRLYAVPTGGTPLWTEYWTTGNAVNVSDGLFSVLLGSLTVNPSLASVVQGNTQLWLGIAIGTDTEMTPRVQLGSAAYSMQALTVSDSAITISKLASNSVDGTKIQDGTIDSSDLANASVIADKIANGSVNQAKAPSLIAMDSSQPGSGQGYKMLMGDWCIPVGPSLYAYDYITYSAPFTSPPRVFAIVHTLQALNAYLYVATSNAPTVTRTQIFVGSSIAQTICGQYLAVGR